MKKIGTAVATASLLATAFVPAAFADTSVGVTGNGSSSVNLVSVDNTSTTMVDQTSKTTAFTTVYASGSTGKNTANGNTGGSVSLTSGDVTNTVTVTVTGGDNTATLPASCGCNSATGVVLSGNGTGSLSNVGVNNASLLVASQLAKTKAFTMLTVKGKTGSNNTNNNTGTGVGVLTGGVTNTSTVTVSGGSNTLH